MCLVINIIVNPQLEDVLTSSGASFTVAGVTSLTIANVRSVCIVAAGVDATDVGKRRAFVDI